MSKGRILLIGTLLPVCFFLGLLVPLTDIGFFPTKHFGFLYGWIFLGPLYAMVAYLILSALFPHTKMGSVLVVVVCSLLWVLTGLITEHAKKHPHPGRVASPPKDPAAIPLMQSLVADFTEHFHPAAITNAMGVTFHGGVAIKPKPWFREGPLPLIDLALSRVDGGRLAVGIKVFANGTVPTPSPAEYPDLYHANPVGSRSYGGDIRGKGVPFDGSRLEFTSSCKSWFVVVDSQEVHIQNLTRLAEQIDAWFVRWSSDH